MYCQNCGIRIIDSDKFCSNCGFKTIAFENNYVNFSSIKTCPEIDLNTFKTKSILFKINYDSSNNPIITWKYKSKIQSLPQLFYNKIKGKINNNIK